MRKLECFSSQPLCGSSNEPVCLWRLQKATTRWQKSSFYSSIMAYYWVSTLHTFSSTVNICCSLFFQICFSVTWSGIFWLGFTSQIVHLHSWKKRLWIIQCLMKYLYFQFSVSRC